MKYQHVFGVMAVIATVFVGALGVSTLAVAEEGDGDEAAEEVADADGADVTEYKVDAVHSSVVFRIKYQDVGYVFGMFREFGGDFVFDEENPENSSFDFTIAADSVFTNQERRDDHLRNPDFFSAEEHPEITFESTEVTHRGGDTYEITGDLTMRGTTKEITMLADDTGSRLGENQEFRRGFLTTFAVDRMDFGVDFDPEGLGQIVRVTLAVQGTGLVE